MERRANIRMAIRTLLSPETQPEAIIKISDRPEPGLEVSKNDSLMLNALHAEMLSPLQASLRSSCISADLPEIAGAILEALAVRPSLCQGLLASYLLEA